MSHQRQNFSVSLNAIGPLLDSYSLLKKTYNANALSEQEVGFSTNSGKTGPNTGFIAYAGVANDGHRYIQSIASSVAFIISENDESAVAADGTPIFVVTSGRGQINVDNI